MANGSSCGVRARIAAAAGTLFSPSRWSVHDAVAAIAALALAILVFVPWFQAIVRIRGRSTTGFLIDPPGDLAGIAAHSYLWLAFALALLQCVILAACKVPDQHALLVLRYRRATLALSAVALVIVLTAVFTKPAPWYDRGGPFPPPFYVVIGWAAGAIAATAAGIVALVASALAVLWQSEYERPW